SGMAPCRTCRFSSTTLFRSLPFGWAGVWLFFVISGYVVTLSIARAHDPNFPVRGAANFARHRIGRILPPYYAYLLAGLAFSFIADRKSTRLNSSHVKISYAV